MNIMLMLFIDCIIGAIFIYLSFIFEKPVIFLLSIPVFMVPCDGGMQNLKTMILIIACHMIGDYLFQNEFIANTKGSNWYHLFVHCVLYAVPFAVVFGWCWQLALITIAHFPIDALKARWKKTTYAEDQALHYLLAMTYML